MVTMGPSLQLLIPRSARSAPAAVLTLALAGPWGDPAAAGPLEVRPEQGQSAERMKQDISECRELARHAAAESHGRLRISPPVPVEGARASATPGSGIPRPEAQGGGSPGLFGGLRRPGAVPPPPQVDRARAARKAERREIEKAYAACLKARGYSVEIPEGD